MCLVGSEIWKEGEGWRYLWKDFDFHGCLVEEKNGKKGLAVGLPILKTPKF